MTSTREIITSEGGTAPREDWRKCRGLKVKSAYLSSSLFGPISTNNWNELGKKIFSATPKENVERNPANSYFAELHQSAEGPIMKHLINSVANSVTF